MKTNYLTLFILSATLAVSCSKTEINSSTQSTSADNSLTSATRTSLVAWYTFNGDVLDHSIYGNNIDFNSATATAGKDGSPNSAYYFDGSSSYMTAPASTSLNNLSHGITMAVVINPLGFYHGQYHANRIIQKGYRDQSDGVYYLGFDDALSGDNSGNVADSMESFYGVYGNTQFNAASARDTIDFIKKNRWYTVVCTVDTNKVARLYINGVLKNTNYTASTGFNPNADPLYIGRIQDDQFPYWFHGIIDEIRIYNRAYDASAVSEISKQMTH